MLVLSRRPGQKIVFPGLGITIEVLQSKGAVTRLGIQAPDEIKVHREEILGKPDAFPGVSSQAAAEKEARHRLNNQLNAVTLRLSLLQRQIALGKTVELDGQLRDVLGQLNELENAMPDSRVTDVTPQVLIVEDQANERELLADCLRLSGLSVATASNGMVAFNYLHENEMPDLVLLDMQMPELDGPGFIKMVRDDFRLHSLKVFAVSGSTREDFSSSLPIDGWFPKPVRVDSILEAVRETSRSPAAQV